MERFTTELDLIASDLRGGRNDRALADCEVLLALPLTETQRAVARYERVRVLIAQHDEDSALMELDDLRRGNGSVASLAAIARCDVLKRRKLQDGLACLDELTTSDPGS